MFMLDLSRSTLSDMQRVSQSARIASLNRELEQFKNNLLLFLSDKESFVDELYWRLRLITSRWNSLHRRGLGERTNSHIISPNQVEELLHWEYYLKQKNKHECDSFFDIYADEKLIDVLVRFFQARSDSMSLYDQFVKGIYEPLVEFFKDAEVKYLARDLKRVLQRWQDLHAPGPINHNLFSPSSADAVYYMENRNRFQSLRFNRLLRLIPDLALKAVEALLLAQKWRENRNCISGYTRELRYIRANWYPKRRKSDLQSDSSDVKEGRKPSENLDTYLENTGSFLGKQSQISETEEKQKCKPKHAYVTETVQSPRCFFYYLELNVYTFDEGQRYLSSDKKEKSILNEGKQRIDVLREQIKCEQLRIQRTRAKLFYIEFWKKFAHEIPMTRRLEEELQERKKACKILQDELCKSRKEKQQKSCTAFILNQ